MRARDYLKRRVLELMTIGGLNQSEAARKVGVKTSTIGSWKLSDKGFLRKLEEWRSGPPPDPATIAQARSLIVDELARRIHVKRSTMKLNEIFSIQDRLVREAKRNQPEEKDVYEGNEESGRLTPEDAERIWQEIERDAGNDEEPPAEEPPKP